MFLNKDKCNFVQGAFIVVKKISHCTNNGNRGTHWFDYVAP